MLDARIMQLLNDGYIIFLLNSKNMKQKIFETWIKTKMCLYLFYPIFCYQVSLLKVSSFIW